MSLAVMLVLGLLAIPAMRDQRNYRLGIETVENTQCGSAIESFDKIIAGWRLVDFNDYVPAAQEKKAECLTFETAVEEHRAGNYGAAFLAYHNFVHNYPNSPLTQTVYDLVQLLLSQAQVEQLVNQQVCGNIDALSKASILPEPDTNLPRFYLACGALYDSLGEPDNAYEMYISLLTGYPQYPQGSEAIASLMYNPVACQKIEALLENPASLDQTGLIPSLYFGCGEIYANQGNLKDASQMHFRLLWEYPEHALAPEGEKALLENPTFCDYFWLAKNIFVDTRADFMANLSYRCGQIAEGEGEYIEALSIYEYFLSEHADHKLREKIQAAYASIIVDLTKASKTYELSDPQQIGTTGGNRASLVIYNASPEKIRIVLSGPDAYVDELPACKNCRTYTQNEDTTGACPEGAHSKTYQVAQGDYDVVIGPPNDASTYPFAGEWDLLKGNEYYLCIILITNE